MKRVKQVGIIFSILTIATLNAYSANQPANCPSASVIISTGNLDTVIKQSGYVWNVGSLNHQYDTLDNWSFFLYKIKAIDANDAKNKATTSLPSLKFISGPIPGLLPNTWECIYTTDGYPGKTITPSLLALPK